MHFITCGSQSSPSTSTGSTSYGYWTKQILAIPPTWKLKHVDITYIYKKTVNIFHTVKLTVVELLTAGWVDSQLCFLHCPALIYENKEINRGRIFYFLSHCGGTNTFPPHNINGEQLKSKPKAVVSYMDEMLFFLLPMRAIGTPACRICTVLSTADWTEGNEQTADTMASGMP